MSINLVRAGMAVTIAAVLAACTGGNKEKASFEAAVDSMTRQRDSTVRALDTTGVAQHVDTTKLGARKTESVLTKARKDSLTPR